MDTLLLGILSGETQGAYAGLSNKNVCGRLFATKDKVSQRHRIVVLLVMR